MACGFAFVTPWSPNTDLLVRKAFPLPPGATNVRITGTIDNDATVYLNGTQVAPTVLSGSCQSGAIDLAVDDALLAADGNNLLAIRGHDFGVSTMLDVQVTFDDGPAYDICTLYDATKAHRAGATVPLKLQLCDGGVNLSDPSIVVHATGVYLSDADPAETVVEDAGNANPDQDFRYDADLGGYIYNLKTTGLTPGTWAVGFTVDGEVDPSSVVTFDVK